MPTHRAPAWSPFYVARAVVFLGGCRIVYTWRWALVDFLQPECLNIASRGFCWLAQNLLKPILRARH